MEDVLSKAMETFSLDLSDDDKYLKSTMLEQKKVLNKIKNTFFRLGPGVKSPITMHPISSIFRMRQHYYFDSQRSQTHVWKFRTYKEDKGWLSCEFIFFPATLSIHELITSVQGSYYIELKYLQNYTFEFLK